MAKGETVTGPDGSPIELADVGQKLLFENDQVRVWEIILAPGEQQAWHRHEHPYLVIALGSAANRIDALTGDVRQVNEEAGGVVYREPGEVHMLSNEGATVYVSRLIELKQA
jgi:quercetin dioxygenase-like cupin family protein